MEKSEVSMDKFQVQHPVIIPLPCYICILCDIKFANQTDLDLHNQLHAGTSGFSCSLCKEILPDLHQLQLHDLQHSLAEAQEDVGSVSNFDIFTQACASCICIICGEGFNSEEELTIHCAVHAEGTEENILDEEKENGYIEPALLNPSGSKIVLAKKSFQRPTRPCSRRPPAPFETRDSLDAAKLLFANSVKMENQQLTYSVTDNQVHYFTTGNEVESSAPKPKRRKSKFTSTCARNKCDQCKRIFSNSFSLKRHKSIIHLNKRPYACTFCRKTFIEMSLLTRHTLRNHASNDYIFTCEHCKEEFPEQELLHRHISIVHNMKYSCEACFKFFVTQEEHAEHMSEHVRTFGFDCCRCRRRYRNDWELKRHKCTTEGPRPYLCKICGKRFNRKYHLTRHFTVHQTRGGSVDVGFGVKIEYDSEGVIEQPIHVKPRKNKIIYTGRKADFMSHYKNGRKLILNKKMKFQCYICDVRWPNLRRYKQHFIMAHKKVKFNSCHICGKQFETAYKVRRHLLCHDLPEKTKETTNTERTPNSNNPPSYTTANANKDQKSTSKLEDGNEAIQDRKRDIECYICHQKCSNLRRFKLHFKSQHKNFEFNSCHLCSKHFPDTQEVVSHLTSFHAPVKTAHQDGKSQESFHDYPSEIIVYNNPMIAELNVNTYGRGVRKTFTCYICKENCLSYRRYRQHFHMKHKGIKLNACHLCNKQFATTSKVKRHLQSHTHERNFKCHACGRRFAQLSHLKRHRILMHTVKSYRLRKCMYCPKLYADKASFEKHVNMHELAEQSNFQCSVCKEKFVEERLLDEHILAFHDFFKKYQCPTCKRRFSHQSYLSRHMVIHSAIKKWKCFTCNKRFSTKSDLNRHSLTHTDLKPFPCFFCEKCFTRNSNRQKHVSIFHNIRNVDVFDDKNDIKPFQNLTDQQKLVMMTFN